MIKIIATDMDGTLLDDRGYLDKELLETILNRLDQKGITFVIASGNTLERLLEITQELSDRMMFVADNGARIVQQGREIHRHCLFYDTIIEVADYYQERLKTYCFMVSDETNSYMLKGSPRPFENFKAIAPSQLEQFYQRIRLLDSIEQLPKQASYYKMGMWAQEEMLEEIIAECNDVFEGKLEAVTSGFGSIDLLPRGINKATGLQKILEPLGLDGSHLMAFGDNDNDREMLELAAMSYAVGTASSKIREVALAHLPSNRDSAVLREITAFLDKNDKIKERTHDSIDFI